jgi:hypothetical protein
MKFPMRQLLSLFLSFGAVIIFSSAPARSADSPLTAAADAQVKLAQIDLQRVQDLVDTGALPRIRIAEAEAKIEDAKDQAILTRDLFAEPPDKSTSEAVSAELTAAAQRRLDRQTVRVEEARKLVDAGIAAKSYLEPFEAELNSRHTALDLAQIRAHLLTDLAAAKPQPPAPGLFSSAPVDDAALLGLGMEHYEGDGAFNESRDLPPLELAFCTRFNRPLPISAEGETEVHRALGFDHRGRVDVALVPDAAEGIWLRQYLQARKIPYYAFAHAVPGKATAAHIHIGPGSTHLANTTASRLSKHSAGHAHNAD